MGLETMGSLMQSVLPSVDSEDTYTESDGLKYCRKCKTPRQFRMTGDKGKVYVLPRRCDCQEAEYQKQEAALKEQDEKRKIEKLARYAFPAKSMREKTFANDDGRFGQAEVEKAKNYVRRFQEENGKLDYGLLFFGVPDSGKTYLSCCIANAVVDMGKRVIMRSTPQLLVDRDDGMLERMMSCDLLVLDDLGAERSTSYGQEYVYAVIDGRYSTQKPMIISTNLTRQELAQPADIMSQRIYNRVLEACLPVEVNTGRKRATRERYAEILKDLES